MDSFSRLRALLDERSPKRHKKEPQWNSEDLPADPRQWPDLERTPSPVAPRAEPESAAAILGELLELPALHTQVPEVLNLVAEFAQATFFAEKVDADTIPDMVLNTMERDPATGHVLCLVDNTAVYELRPDTLDLVAELKLPSDDPPQDFAVHGDTWVVCQNQHVEQFNNQGVWVRHVHDRTTGHGLRLTESEIFVAEGGQVMVYNRIGELQSVLAHTVTEIAALDVAGDQVWAAEVRTARVVVWSRSTGQVLRDFYPILGPCVFIRRMVVRDCDFFMCDDKQVFVVDRASGRRQLADRRMSPSQGKLVGLTVNAEHQLLMASTNEASFSFLPATYLIRWQ